MRFRAVEFLKVAALMLPAFFGSSIFWLFGARELVAGFASLVIPTGLLAWAISKLKWPVYVVGYVCTLVPFALMVGFLTIFNTDLIFKDLGNPKFFLSDLANEGPLLIVFMSLGFAWAYVFRGVE